MIISSKILKDIVKFFMEHINYKKLTNIDIALYTNKIDTINKLYKTNISHSQIIDMRNAFIFLLAKTKGTLAHRLGDKIYTEYKNKNAIIDISKKYVLPTMTIVRQILIELKYESHKIETIIKKNAFPKDIQAQLPSILKNDPIFWYVSNIPKIYNKINKLNTEYTIKYDLIKFGKCPDILFNKICQYKRKEFIWIVFKPYILFDSYLHMHDIEKIINNFKRYGPGLILYTDIICSNSFIKKLHTTVEIYEFFD